MMICDSELCIPRKVHGTTNTSDNRPHINTMSGVTNDQSTMHTAVAYSNPRMTLRTNSRSSQDSYGTFSPSKTPYSINAIRQLHTSRSLDETGEDTGSHICYTAQLPTRGDIIDNSSLKEASSIMEPPKTLLAKAEHWRQEHPNTGTTQQLFPGKRASLPDFMIMKNEKITREQQKSIHTERMSVKTKHSCGPISEESEKKTEQKEQKTSKK